MTTPTPGRDRMTTLEKAVAAARSRASTVSLVGVPEEAGSRWHRELATRLETAAADALEHGVANYLPALPGILGDAAAAVRVLAEQHERRERQVAIAEEALATAPTRRDTDPATTRQAPPLPSTRSQAYALLEAFGSIVAGDVVEHVARPAYLHLVIDVDRALGIVMVEGLRGGSRVEAPIENYAVPRTSEEAAERSDRVSLRSEYAKRCSDLCAAGLIRDTGATRTGATGRERILYTITETGRDYLKAHPRD